jgi:hypothetical protein
MLYEGRRVGVADLQLFMTLYASSDSEDPRAEALDSLLTFLVLESAARDLGLTLSEEDRQYAREDAEYIRQSFADQGYRMPNVSTARLEEYMTLYSLMDMLSEHYTADVALDEAAFALEFADYLAYNKAEYIDMQLKYVYAISSVQAREAHEELLAAAPEDVDAIILKYMGINYDDTDYAQDEYEVQYVPLADLAGSGMFEGEWLAAAAEMQVGDIMEPLDLGDSAWYVFVVDSVEIPTDAEVEEKLRGQLLSTQKTVVFLEKITELKNNADVRINEKGYLAA